MRSIVRALILLFAVIAGLYIVPYMLIIRHVELVEYKALVTDKMDVIVSALNEMLARSDVACVRGERYFAPNGAVVLGPFAGAQASYLPRTCDRCDDLVAAGLLETSVTETHDAFTGTRSRLTLTPFGREVYGEEVTPSWDSTRQFVQWKFCFGKAQVYRVDEALPPVGYSVGVKYTPEVLDPHAFLFDPRSRPLRLEVPKRGRPALLEPKVTTITFREDGTAEIDGVRYGKFMDQ